MRRFSDFFRTDAQLGWKTRLILGSLLFILFFAAYGWMSHQAHVDNPDNKTMPSLTQIIAGTKQVAIEKNRKEEIQLWVDTLASAKRVGGALVLIMLSVPLGLLMGCFPWVDAIFSKFLIVFRFFPAIALMPLLFSIFVGHPELTRMALIVLGLFPILALDARLRALEVSREEFEVTQSLGATELEIAYPMVLTQIWPNVLDTLRLNLHVIFTLLMVSERMAASAGLGYRILVSDRQVNNAIIIPYVLMIAILMFAADSAITAWIKWRYKWLNKA